MEAKFKPQVELLLDILPLVLADERFAMKGGTAINLFVRDMPRLSVDIDLTYLPSSSRDQALKDIDEGLLNMGKRINKAFPSISSETKRGPGIQAKQIVLVKAGARVKVEINQVLRETVFPNIEMDLCEAAQNLFNRFVSARILSFEDLYAGKIVAALDRQHPRDFFDVRLMLREEGFSEHLRKVTLVYLVSHNRPISELLAPTELDLQSIFEHEFVGMTNISVAIEDLSQTRRDLVKIFNDSLTQSEKEFLLSIKDGTPDWPKLGLEIAVDRLPAIQWKLMNIQKMEKSKRQAAYEKLKRVLKV